MSVGGEPVARGGGASLSVGWARRFLMPVDGLGTGLRQVRFWTLIVLICAGSGVVYGAISPFGRPVVGAIYGAVIGTGIMLFEQGVIAPGLQRWLRARPLLVGVVCTELVYIVIVMAGSALTGAVLKSAGVMVASWAEVMVPPPVTLLYSLVVSGTVITVNRMRELIGTEVFRNLLIGRYHQPIEEERIFLFLDLIGSTAYAQRHGDLRAQAFLGAIYTALAEPVRRQRGSIDDYVGDMALVTWPLAQGVAHGRCVASVFAFFETIERDAERWRRDFGQVPRFRAALHGGRVVTAEVGLDRHKIAYFGDVVNTTGRIEALCRTLDSPVLISSDLYDRIETLPRGIIATPRGAHAVKGRGQSLAVLALEPGGPDVPVTPQRAAVPA